jgi:hypothetical protein
MLEERSIGQAARFRGLEVSAMVYWVRHFLALGLIQMSRVERRAGRVLKYYRCIASGYLSRSTRSLRPRSRSSTTDSRSRCWPS